MRGRLEPGQDDHDGFPGSPPWGPCPRACSPAAAIAARYGRRCGRETQATTSRADDPGPGCRCRPSGLSPRGSGNRSRQAPCWRTAMTPPSKSRWDRSAHYQIVVRGELSDRFAHAFPEMTLQPEAGYTRITGVIVDQPHLHGILEGPSQLRHRARQRQRSCRKLVADRAEAGPKSARTTTPVQPTCQVHRYLRRAARERSGVDLGDATTALVAASISSVTGGAEGPGSRPDVWRVRAAEHQLRPGRDVVPSFAKIAGRRARRTPAASMPRHSHASPMKGSRLSSE